MSKQVENIVAQHTNTHFKIRVFTNMSLIIQTWRVRPAFERATCAIMDPQLKTQVTYKKRDNEKMNNL